MLDRETIVTEYPEDQKIVPEDLRFGLDFKKELTDKGIQYWFVSGGGECVGGNGLHMYHSSMNDPVYAMGSLIVANLPVPDMLLLQALDNLEGFAKWSDITPSTKRHLDCLINLLQTAKSHPLQGEEIGTAEDYW